MLVQYFTRDQIAEIRERQTMKFDRPYQFYIKDAEERSSEWGTHYIALTIVPFFDNDEFPIVFENLVVDSNKADVMERCLDFFESIRKVDLQKTGQLMPYMLLKSVGTAYFHESEYKDKTGNVRKNIKVKKFILDSNAEKDKPFIDDDITL